MGKLTQEVFNESCCDGGAGVCENDTPALAEKHYQQNKDFINVPERKMGPSQTQAASQNVKIPAQTASVPTVGLGEPTPLSTTPAVVPTVCKYGHQSPKDKQHRCEYIQKNTTLLTDAAKRKEYPITTGCLDYFPLALMAVAHCSYVGNEQHNPGQPLHWARGKSTDHADALLRHMKDRGTIDTDGVSHTSKVAWRALALLQEELEHG